MQNWNSNRFLILGSLLGIYITVLTWFGYSVYRSEFSLLLITFAVLFLLMVSIFTQVDTRKKLMSVIAFSVGARIVLLGIIPNMSDDFYRFIWDGVLLANGVNPFDHIPAYYMEQTGGAPGTMIEGLSATLFEGMNSPDYHTIYPPICQAVFWLGATLFGGEILGNVVVMRIFSILAEIVTIWYLLKILRIYNRDPRWVLLFALNPIVIMELTGNLHFEGVMIAFLIAGFYYLLVKRYITGFLLIALSINTKLIPLIFLPYLAFSLGWRRTLQMSGIIGTATVLLHLPFYDLSFIENFLSSVELYFQKFEFNASIYYIVRWIGYQVKGYNIIESAGRQLPIYATLLILLVSWILRNPKLRTLPHVAILTLASYYFLATIVHPWYIITLLAFVPLSGYLFPLIWTMLLPLTYHVYRTQAYEEVMWFVAIEYVIVYFVFLMDIWQPEWYRNTKKHIYSYCCKPVDNRFDSGHETTVITS